MYFSFIVCLVCFFFAFDNRMTLSFLRAFQYKDLARSRAHFGGSEENHQRAAWLCLYTWRILSTGPELNVASWRKSSPSGEDRRRLLKTVAAC